jgi:hypothetical protein
MNQTAKDDAERSRNHARLWAPPKDARPVPGRDGPRRGREGGAPGGAAPHGGGMNAAEAAALVARMEQQDADLAAGRSPTP